MPEGYVEDNPYSVKYTLFLLVFTAIVFPIARLIMKKHIIPLFDIIEEQEFKYMAWLSALLLGLLSAGFAVMRTELINTSVSVFLCLVLCAAVCSVYAVTFIFLRKINDAQKLRIKLLNAELFKFDCSIDIPIKINVSDVYLVTILGSLLENALEAGRQLPEEERSVIVNIGFSHTMLGITVDNRFDGTVKFSDGNYVSIKHKRAALGIMSVKNIAEKYQGSAVFEHKGNMFYASVMLTNLPSEE